MIDPTVPPSKTSQSDALLQEIAKLKQTADTAQLPPGLYEKVSTMLARLERTASYEGYSEEYERVNHYLDWVINLPWNKLTPDTLDLTRAKQILDKHHFGLEEIKERVLEYLAVLKLNLEKGQTATHARAPILLLVGLVGTGKTTFAYSLAEATGRQVVRIPFGGMGSARDLRGQSRLHLESEPGYIIKALRRVQTRNPVVLLDEIDRVSEAGRADIMGVLVELLDPEQNSRFIDHFIDFPFDLSSVLFVGTANNTRHIATAVMDRMEPISMPSYTDEQKIIIGKDYLLPQAIEEAGLPPNSIVIDEAIWPKIVRPLGYDAGIRTLQRTIKGISRKVAKARVEGNLETVHLDQNNLSQYLPTYKSEISF
jgi:ATP-dependent Lon protease